MAKLAIAAAMLLSGLTTSAANAEDTTPADETLAAAAQAGVPVQDVQGALNSLADAGMHISAHAYLISVGDLAPPSPPEAPPRASCDWPICGALGQRIWCVEGIESRHGAAMYNPTPVWDGEHAQGFLGFLPSTARAWGASIGNRASEWNAAAKMIGAGAGGQFAGIAYGRC